MKPTYDWHKGQDAWDEDAALGQNDGNARTRVSWTTGWRPGLVVILIISLIGVSVYWILDQRAQSNRTAVEEDVLSTNSLVFQAILAQDLELLHSNLSGREPDWVTGLETAVTNEVFYNRPSWGLNIQSGEQDKTAVEIHLNPEWNTAELSIPLTYHFRQSNNLTTSVQLEQTLIYRRSQNKWLLSPPDGNFWGESKLYRGRYLMIHYPARDEEIVNRLAIDLESYIEELCERWEDRVCQVFLQVPIWFDSDLTNLLTVTKSGNLPPCSQFHPILPTPTLVGMPIDEDGYEALLTGYQTEIAAYFVVQSIYTPVCPRSPLITAASHYRLSKLGLRSWTLSAEDYDYLVQKRVHLEQISLAGQMEFFNQDYPDDLRPYYALIEFLVEETGIDLRDIEQHSRDFPIKMFNIWSVLEQFIDDQYSDRELEQIWIQFLKSKTSQNGIQSNFPDQNLIVACRANPFTETVYPSGALYELDLATYQWTAVFPLNPDAFLLSAPGGGVITGEQNGASIKGSPAQLLFIHEGEASVLFESTDSFLPVSFIERDDRNEQLLVYNLPDRGYGVLSEGSCPSPDNCEMEQLPGYPIVSPTGERTVWLPYNGNQGYETQFVRPFSLFQSTTPTLGTGKSQFWLDDDRLGYIAEDGRTVMVITFGDSTQEEYAEELFTLSEVDPLLALDPMATIQSVVTKPQEPQDLLVTATNGEGIASIYQVNILRRWIQKLKDKAFILAPVNSPTSLLNFQFSPTGRWLLISRDDSAGSTVYLHFYDVAENEVHSFDYRNSFDQPIHWTFDWSQEDEWLAVPDNGYIRLIDPERDYQDVIVPDGISCSEAVWVD